MCRVFCWLLIKGKANVNVKVNGAGCSLVTAGPRPVWVCGGRREPFHGGSYQTSMFGKAPANPPRPEPPTPGRWPKGPSAGRGTPRSKAGRAKPGTSSPVVEPGLARLLHALWRTAGLHRFPGLAGRCGFAGGAVNPSMGAWSRHPCRSHPRKPTPTRLRQCVIATGNQKHRTVPPNP